MLIFLNMNERADFSRVLFPIGTCGYQPRLFYFWNCTPFWRLAGGSADSCRPPGELPMALRATKVDEKL
jgi:hypothetical protein